MTPRWTDAPEPSHPDLTARATHLPELMDDPHADPRALAATYRRFALVNPIVAGWRRVWVHRIRPVFRTTHVGSLLDLGCGGGDVARTLARWAEADGIDLHITGVDPDERAIRAATRGAAHGVTFRRASSGELVEAGERFDVVVSNHVLHHLGADELPGFLDDSTTLAGRLAVHSDIRRSRAAYREYSFGSRFVAPGTFLRIDGLRSIRRSYTADELRAAAPGWDVRAEALHRVVAARVVSSAPTGAAPMGAAAP